jgi:hypothetical protein
MTNHTDSGGGVFSSYHIVCRNGSWESADVLYELSFKYEDGIENHGFDYAIDEAYYYMQSYMRGNSLADRARYFENKYRKDTKLKTDEWMKVFSLDDDVSELPITKKGEVVHEHERDIPVDAFEYMAMEGRFEKGHIKPFKELRSQVVTAKQWAMIALLEMQRYHCTSC